MSAVGIAACSGDPGDSAATSATPAASTPTVSSEAPATTGEAKPEVVEPTLPAEAEGESVSSAKAFVEYYIDLLNYAMVTGDTKAFRAASTNCEGCDRYADLFERTYRAGGSAETKGWRVTSSFVTEAHTVTSVLADIQSSPLTIRKSKNAKPERFTADRYELRVDLRSRAAAWIVTNLQGA